MKKLLVICGPTATGKTGLAIKLAEKFNGELISADSRQVYREMDIGTGKDIAGGVWRTVKRRKEGEPQGYWEIEGVPIHLLDIVNPNEEFSVSHYYRLAWQEIKSLWRRKKLPLLVGGTGFYIKAVVDGIDTIEIPPNPKLRQILEGKSADELFTELDSLDPLRAAAMNRSDRKNPRRLIRAIEIARWQIENRAWASPTHKTPATLFVGLSAPYKLLYQRIDRRVEERVKQGIEKEIKELLDKGYSWESSVLGETLAYQEWQPFFEGKASKEEIIQRWKFDEHGYARRQMAWFKKDKRIHWFDITQKRWQDRVIRLVREWLVKKDAQKN